MVDKRGKVLVSFFVKVTFGHPVGLRARIAKVTGSFLLVEICPFAHAPTSQVSNASGKDLFLIPLKRSL